MIFKYFYARMLAFHKVEPVEQGNIKEEIELLNDGLQQKLLWSNIGAVWSYLLLVLVIVRLYGNYFKGDSLVITFGLFLMYALLGLLMYVVWKSIAYQKVYIKSRSKLYLKVHFQRLVSHSRTISVYLLLYWVLLAITSVIFFMDMHNGISVIFKVTTPLNLICYLAGIFLIIILSIQQRKLDVLHKNLEKAELLEKIR